MGGAERQSLPRNGFALGLEQDGAMQYKG